MYNIYVMYTQSVISNSNFLNYILLTIVIFEMFSFSIE